jgi:N-acetylglucosamine-6-sulfatase
MRAPGFRFGSTLFLVSALVANSCAPAPELKGAAATPTNPGPSPTVERRQPNIVLILTDDQRWDQFRSMPNTRRLLIARGVDFTNAFVVNPLCCPSRASILTGNYSHRTGVYENTDYNVFRRRDESSTIATWLDRSGYRTALIGKYLNGYGLDDRHVPPGWDRWVAFARHNAAYYDYNLNVDGRVVHHGYGRADYSTDLLASAADAFIASTPSDRPLFLYFAPFAPHGPQTPAPRDVGTWNMQPPLDPPNQNEADVSDKPPYVRNMPLAGEAATNDIRLGAEESLLAVDDAVRGIVRALKDSGRLHDTLIVFASDNGMAAGEHRRLAKSSPYEESIRVPLVIRYDLIRDLPTRRSQMVLNIDLAPTFAAVAGASYPSTDGRSLLPLLDRAPVIWRNSFVIEHELMAKDAVPSFCAIRTTRWKFVRYADGFEELYNLANDPYEMQNIAGDPSSQRMVSRFRNESRARCRPLPPGMPPF